jgi:hypothetical protein
MAMQKKNTSKLLQHTRYAHLTLSEQILQLKKERKLLLRADAPKVTSSLLQQYNPIEAGKILLHAIQEDLAHEDFYATSLSCILLNPKNYEAFSIFTPQHEEEDEIESQEEDEFWADDTLPTTEPTTLKKGKQEEEDEIESQEEDEFWADDTLPTTETLNRVPISLLKRKRTVAPHPSQEIPWIEKKHKKIAPSLPAIFPKKK